jgi:4'-phosphopantetheinyl transferase
VLMHATPCIDPADDGWGTLSLQTGEWHASAECAFGQPADIHVYKAELSAGESQIGVSAALLSPAERARADRFRFPHDRARYIMAHGALREIVGAYAGIPPERIEFSFSRYGKPALSGFQPGIGIEFNMSHAGDVALIALSEVGPLGVDIEHVREETDPGQLAEACLTPGEIRMLGTMPVHERIETVYRWWTRKEALAKALGEGLAQPLTRYQVVPPFVTREGGGPAGRHPWGVWDISPYPGYVATLVANGAVRSVRLLVHEPRGLIA